MDLKEYSPRPEEGLFDNVMLRVRRRRIVRLGAVAAAVLVAVAALWLMGREGLDGSHQAVDQAALGVNAVDKTAVGERQAERLDADRMAAADGHVPTAQSTADCGLRTAEVAAAPFDPDLRGVPSARPTTPTAEHPVPTADLPVPPADLRGVPSARPTTPTADLPVPTADLRTPWCAVGSADNAELRNKRIASADEVATVPPADLASPSTKGGVPQATSPHYDNVLWAPNVIAPLDDDEGNHTFRVVSSSSVSEYHIYIYNRGGRQVYSSVDINAVWDATFDGMPLPQGTYVWVARFRDSTGLLRQEKGTVTVLR